MVDRSRIELLTGVLASLLLPGLSGCARLFKPTETVRLCASEPNYYDYYYYPYSEVYYHFETGYYYYKESGRYGSYEWRRSLEMPGYMHLDAGDRICLTIRAERPYDRHAEVRRRYPPPYAVDPTRYWYYPYWAVYLHIYTGEYYYYDDRSWQRSRELPPHIRLKGKRRFLLNIRDELPWLRHAEHRRRFPPPDDRAEDEMPPIEVEPEGPKVRPRDRKPARETHPAGEPGPDRSEERWERPERLKSRPGRPEQLEGQERRDRPERPQWQLERPENRPERPERPERDRDSSRPEQQEREYEPPERDDDDYEPPEREPRDDDTKPVWWPPGRD